MWNPLSSFFNLFKKKKEEVQKDERTILLEKIDLFDLKMLLQGTNLIIDDVSIEFLRLLVNNPTLFKRLRYHYRDTDIILKLNNNSLRLSDIKEYDKELLEFDIFPPEDEMSLKILREKVDGDREYTAFKYEDFINSSNNNTYIDSTINSLFEGLSIVASRKSVIVLPNTTYIGEDNSTLVLYSLDYNKVLSINDINYYTDTLELDDNVIIAISYANFLEWVKDESKKEILNKVKVIINDDFDKPLIHTTGIFSQCH